MYLNHLYHLFVSLYMNNDTNWGKKCLRYAVILLICCKHEFSGSGVCVCDFPAFHKAAVLHMKGLH